MLPKPENCVASGAKKTDPSLTISTLHPLTFTKFMGCKKIVFATDIVSSSNAPTYCTNKLVSESNFSFEMIFLSLKQQFIQALIMYSSITSELIGNAAKSFIN